MAKQDTSRFLWTGKAYCAAKWCCNRNSADISLSRFPLDHRLKDWVAYANRPEFLDYSTKKVHEQRLCSEHFRSTDFIGASRRLKFNAVSSVPVTNRHLRPLVPPAFFLDPSDIAGAKALALEKAAGLSGERGSAEADVEPGEERSSDGGVAGQRETPVLKIIHRNVYVAADGGTKFRDRVVKIPASRHRKTAECREIPSLEEPSAEEERVPSPLELPVFPDELFPGMDCEDVDMIEEVVDLGLDVTSDYDEPREPETKTVAQQTEHSSWGVSKFSTFLCSLSKDGASTQVSHGLAEHSYNVAEGPAEWLISYLVY
uniref:THAP-type domain-containing protein n=1 Tax=Ixodes ricinus TaxID=34613 RepID=V5HQP8_IXORI